MFYLCQATFKVVKELRGPNLDLLFLVLKVSTTMLIVIWQVFFGVKKRDYLNRFKQQIILRVAE